MKAQIRLKHAVVEVSGETQKELFKEMASAHEVFGEACCGLCGSEDIVPAYRTVTQGKKCYEYPEYHCRGVLESGQRCDARLSLGSMMEGGVLFPIRKLADNGRPSRADGKYGPSNGWTRYKGSRDEEGG